MTQSPTVPTKANPIPKFRVCYHRNNRDRNEKRKLVDAIHARLTTSENVVERFFVNFFRNLLPKRVSGTFPSVILLSIRHFCLVKRNSAFFAASGEKKLKLIVVPAPFFHFTSALERWKKKEKFRNESARHTYFMIHGPSVNFFLATFLSPIRINPPNGERQTDAQKLSQSERIRQLSMEFNKKALSCGSIDGWLVPHLSTLRCLIKHARKSAEKSVDRTKPRHPIYGARVTGLSRRQAGEGTRTRCSAV